MKRLLPISCLKPVPVLLVCCLATTALKVPEGKHRPGVTSAGQNSASSGAPSSAKLPPPSHARHQSGQPKTGNGNEVTTNHACPQICSVPQAPPHRSSSPCPNADCSSSDIELHVVGLFAWNGSYDSGRAFQYAAELAEEDINNCLDMLPGYKLVLESSNTQCKIFPGMDALYSKLYNKTSVKIMVLGGTCSDVTEQTARVSWKRNMLQVSYSAVSPHLTRANFPWFFRVMAPESELSNARLELLKKFNWSTITMVQAAEHLFSATGEVMRKLLQAHNYTVNATLPFDNDPENVIRALKRNDARIIYFASYEVQARSACCVAYKENFYGKKIVWIFPGFFDFKWYDHDDFNCTAEEKLKVIDGYFTISNVVLDDEGNLTKQQDYKERFRQKALDRLQQENSSRYKEVFKRLKKSGDAKDDVTLVTGQQRAPLAYDAMWAIAHALNDTLTELVHNRGCPCDVLRHFSYDNREMGQLIFQKMKNLTFRGLSGNLPFTDTGARIPNIAIKQFQVDNSTGTPAVTLRRVGLYTQSHQVQWNDTAVKWKGGKVPVCARRTEHVLKPLSWQLYTVMCLLACLGVVLSVSFLVFNIRNRKVRLIKMSSPSINNLILVGCMLVYSTVIVEDIHGYQLDALCHVRLYLLVLGFSLGFGALFAKTWRVYEIMTAGARRLNTRALRDSRLFVTVFVLVSINLGLLVVWTAVDTMEMVPVDIEDSVTDREDDIVEVSQALVCDSRYKKQFTLGLMALQALLILFGAFLAVQTRNISIPELNDSRWVGLCIYNVVVLGSLGTILALGTRQPPHVTYLLNSVIVLVGTTLTIGLAFLPKVLALRRVKQGQKGDQQNVVVVKTVHYRQPSSTSLVSSDVPSSPPPLTSSLPSKALIRASQSMSKVLKRCCTREDAAKSGTEQQVLRRQTSGESDAHEKVNRAVSTCNLISNVWHLPDSRLEMQSARYRGDILTEHATCFPKSKQPFPCRCGWMKVCMPPPDVKHAMLPCGGDRLRMSWPCGSEDGLLCAQSTTDRCVGSYITNVPELNWGQSMRRCASCDTLDSMSRSPVGCHGNVSGCLLVDLPDAWLSANALSAASLSDGLVEESLRLGPSLRFLHEDRLQMRSADACGNTEEGV